MLLVITNVHSSLQAPQRQQPAHPPQPAHPAQPASSQLTPQDHLKGYLAAMCVFRAVHVRATAWRKAQADGKDFRVNNSEALLNAAAMAEMTLMSLEQQPKPNKQAIAAAAQELRARFLSLCHEVFYLIERVGFSPDQGLPALRLCGVDEERLVERFARRGGLGEWSCLIGDQHVRARVKPQSLCLSSAMRACLKSLPWWGGQRALPGGCAARAERRTALFILRPPSPSLTWWPCAFCATPPAPSTPPPGAKQGLVHYKKAKDTRHYLSNYDLLPEWLQIIVAVRQAAPQRLATLEAFQYLVFKDYLKPARRTPYEERLLIAEGQNFKVVESMLLVSSWPAPPCVCPRNFVGTVHFRPAITAGLS